MSSCRLVDLGQGVVMVEFLQPEIHPEHFEALYQALSQATAGILLSCAGPDFALGASLPTLVKNIENQQWEELDRRGRRYQQVNLALRHSSVPVVAALRGHVLGAGCEIALHCHSLVAAPDTRLGLVESRAGLLPGAGGIQELVRRSRSPQQLIQFLSLLVRGHLAAEAVEGFTLGFLDPERDRICSDYSQLQIQALTRIRDLQLRHQPCPAEEVEVLCSFDQLCSYLDGLNLSAYDRELGRTIAGVMSAGQAPGSRIRLQRILDLEREAFRRLAGQPRTQARLRHLLAAGLLAERRDRSS